MAIIVPIIIDNFIWRPAEDNTVEISATVVRIEQGRNYRTVITTEEHGRFVVSTMVELGIDIRNYVQAGQTVYFRICETITAIRNDELLDIFSLRTQEGYIFTLQDYLDYFNRSLRAGFLGARISGAVFGGIFLLLAVLCFLIFLEVKNIEKIALPILIFCGLVFGFLGAVTTIIHGIRTGEMSLNPIIFFVILLGLVVLIMLKLFWNRPVKYMSKLLIAGNYDDAIKNGEAYLKRKVPYGYKQSAYVALANAYFAKNDFERFEFCISKLTGKHVLVAGQKNYLLALYFIIKDDMPNAKDFYQRFLDTVKMRVDFSTHKSQLSAYFSYRDMRDEQSKIELQKWFGETHNAALKECIEKLI